MVKVSVIVPMYQVEKYVSGCLRSIAAQTHADFECICVDDGSRDASGRIAAEFAETDGRFRVIRQENQGPSGARNTGLAHATGQVIAFVDADDYIHPQMFEILLSVMDKEEADVAGCALKKTDLVYRPMPPDMTDWRVKVFIAPLKAFMTNRSVMTSICRLYRKSTIQGMRFIPGIFFEDVPWTVEVMSKIEKYALVDEKLYFYYANLGSIMHSVWSDKKTDSYAAVIDAVYDFIARNRPADLPAVRKYILNSRVKMMFNRIAKSPPDSRADLRAYLRPRLRELSARGRISYAGLKLKHRIALWRMLHGTP
ncbi:MAG: glycosyltransferase [Alphaproteobacteria bacterium]|nr:glycosyltransferase [Alphaproteobacteria bacterium]